MLGGFVMAVSIIFSTISTRNEVNNLSSWKGTTQLNQILNEILIALTNKSFLIFFFETETETETGTETETRAETETGTETETGGLS